MGMPGGPTVPVVVLERGLTTSSCADDPVGTTRGATGASAGRVGEGRIAAPAADTADSTDASHTSTGGTAATTTGRVGRGGAVGAGGEGCRRLRRTTEERRGMSESAAETAATDGADDRLHRAGDRLHRRRRHAGHGGGPEAERGRA